MENIYMHFPAIMQIIDGVFPVFMGSCKRRQKEYSNISEAINVIEVGRKRIEEKSSGMYNLPGK